MRIERGLLGSLPYAAIGSGPPLVVLAGLSPVAGELSDGLVRGTIGPVGELAEHRRLIVLNRWRGMPSNSTMASIAAAHAQALRSGLATPVDIVGMSTGGSIAQQLAADHPGTVRRLGLISTACRLGPTGQRLQARVAALLRAGARRQAGQVAACALAPAPLWPAAAVIGWAAAHRVIAPDQVADLVTTIDAEDRFDLAGCSAIQAPTLLVAGGRDRFYPAELFQQTVALIPGAQLASYPRRGHLSVCWDRRARAALAGFFDWPTASR